MKMFNTFKTGKKLISTVLLLSVVIISIPSTAISSDEDWVETFDSLDYLDSWTVSDGNYTLEETSGVLVGGVPCAGDSWCVSSLWKNSTATIGTWKFDLLLATNHTAFILYFISHSLFADGSHPETGYTLLIKGLTVDLRYRYSNGDRDSLDPNGVYDLPSELWHDWLHFEIMHNSTGHFIVQLNGMKIQYGQDSAISYSEFMNFHLNPGAKLDNVSYSSSTNLSQETPDNNSTSAISGYSLFIILVPTIIIAINRKRKQLRKR